MTIEPLVGERVRLNANGSFTMPKVCEVRSNEIVLQRRYKGRERGKLTVPKSYFTKLNKSFRGAEYACTIKSKI